MLRMPYNSYTNDQLLQRAKEDVRESPPGHCADKNAVAVIGDGAVLEDSEAQDMLKYKKPWLAQVSCIVWYGPIPGSRLHAELLYAKLQDKVHKKSFIFDCLLKEVGYIS